VNDGTRRRWGIGARASVVDLTFASWLVVIPLLFNHRLLNGDGDLIRHIVIGRHVLVAGPRFADPFSFTRAGEPFLAYEWLSQIILATIHDFAGLPGLALFAAALLASALALVVAYVRRGGGDPSLAFLTGAAAAVLTYHHWIMRPHLFTFVGMAALLHVVQAHRRPIWIVPLFALWSNLHPGFLYGLVMVGLWSLGKGVEDLRAGARIRSVVAARAVPFVIAAGASLVNPFGWGLHSHALAWTGSDAARAVAEFMPLAVVSPLGLSFVGVVGILIAGLAAQREWVGWHVLFVLGAGSVAALAIGRNAPMFAVFALPVTVRALTPVFRDLPAQVMGRMREEFARSDQPGWRVSVGATIAVVFLLVVDAHSQRVKLVPGEFSPEVFPKAAVAHAREAGLDGRLLSEWTWGGYILATWPGQRLFVDSMADHFGEELVMEYLQIYRARRGWQDRLACRQFSVVLLPPSAPVLEDLREMSGWVVAYEDRVAVLLVRSHDNGSPES
jgi:hypothetical protein